MQYLISFLEGIITFISPCLLPMLPVYVSYFAGSDPQRSVGKTLKNALGFVLGFTVVFVVLGAFAGTVGAFLQKYQVAVNIVTGLIVVFFGLNFLGVFKLELFRGFANPMAGKPLGFFSAMLFGIIFSVGWTPCVGAFLGSALLMASQQAHLWQGVGMLLSYSVGLGVPFVLSAVLIDRLKGAFSFIKKHYRVVNILSGCFLILMGILMMTGLMGKYLSLLQ